ncbi:hypothetical protein JXQ70_00790 [bacterium]|nr:hypothetical protein [bacterium]
MSKVSSSRFWITSVLSVLFLFCLSTMIDVSVVWAGVDQGQALDDWREAARFRKEYDDGLRWESDFSKDPEGYVEKWLSFKKQFDPFWSAFMKRYGQDRRVVMAAFESVEQPLDVETDIGTLFSILEEVPGKGQNIVDWAVRLGEDSYREWQRGKDNPPHAHKVELWLDKAEKALFAFDLVRKLDPDGEHESRITLAREAVKEARAAFEKNLNSEEMRWPGNNPAWSGEGDPDALCAAAMAFLRAHPDQRGDAYRGDTGEPLAVSLAGQDWEVYKKAPLTEQPTQFSLDFHVAFASLKDSRMAYTYRFSFYTKEEAGVKKAPPFFYANPHLYAHYTMLRENIPQDKSTGGLSRRPTRGFFGLVFRLLLSLGLIGGGLLAAASFLRDKVPALSSVLNTLVRSRSGVGIGLLIIGLLCFLRALVLFFAPLTDLLPQAMAMILGVMLGLDILIKKSTSDTESVDEQAQGKENPVDQAMDRARDAARKAQDLLVEHQARIRKLEQRQVPLGLAAIALGLIHLLAGGLWLF